MGITTLEYRDWTGALREAARRLVSYIWLAALGLGRRARTMSPERWFLIVFALLFLAFFAVLLLQPSSVGRGGR
jgi:hypothetical protein